MIHVLDRLERAWMRVPIALKIAAMLAMVLVLVLSTVSPGMAHEPDPRPFRW